MPERLALDEGARVTINVYVLVVTPSCAVTMVVIVFGPTINGIAPDAVPDVTAAPFTFIAAFGSALVGDIVMDVVVLPTDAV